MAAVKRSLNVGTVGQGRIGAVITRNLAFKAGSAAYLQIHSRSQQKARRICDDISVDGATCAMRLHHDGYATMTKWCDIILLTLKDVDASRAVLLERPDALITNARPGQILVDHTTVDVETSRECAYEAEKRGALFLDAPMSGSPKAAFNNQMVLMIGGDKETYQRMLPIFRMYADTIQHMGASGTGTAAKMISQALVAMHTAAAAEAMRLACQLGVEDHAALLRLLDASWGSSTILRRSAGEMRDLVRNPEKAASASSASIDRMLHDLGLLAASIDSEKAIAAASNSRRTEHLPDNEIGIRYDELPMLSTSMRMFEAAAGAGVGDRDMSAVVQFVEAGALAAREDQLSVPTPVPSSSGGSGGYSDFLSSSTADLQVANEKDSPSASDDNSVVGEGRPGGGGQFQPPPGMNIEFY